jgi:hypothetical protein
MPFPTDLTWWSDFNKAIGDPDEKGQALLAKEMTMAAAQAIRQQNGAAWWEAREGGSR